MVAGLCATHISGAILIGNQASNLILKTSLPVDVDVDVMIAMAARIHVEAAPMITSINLEYLEPYFQKEPQIEPFIDEEIRRYEKERADRIREDSPQSNPAWEKRVVISRGKDNDPSVEILT
jgi:L-serine dehydratase